MIRSSFRSSVQYHGTQLTLAMSPVQALANGRAFVFGASAAAIMQMFVFTPAFAGLTGVATQVCAWAPTVGAIGTALAFIVFIAGLAMIAVGSRDGFGRTIWAVLGAVALFGATGLFQALTAGTCGQASTG